MVFDTIVEDTAKLGQSEADKDKYTGFPKFISSLRGPNSAEILMEALGPNLRKLLKECPGGVFSKATVFKIIIQLVSDMK
mgnify:CR=1 FL=1